MNEKTTAEFREIGKDEMAQVEGGMWMEFLDNWIGAMTGGLCGYGPDGFQGPYQSVPKNKPGTSNP